MWEAAGKQGLARMILVTRLDSDNVQFERLLGDIRESFGNRCRPVFLPVGVGSDCSGVVNVLQAGDAPEGVVGDFAAAGQQVRESIIESNDELMEKYLEGEEVGLAELMETLGRAVTEGTLVPVLCCAAKKEIGVRETIAFLAACAPSAAQGVARSALNAAGEQIELAADPKGALCARVFKVTTDMHVGKVVYLRLYNGTLGANSTIRLSRTGKDVRLGHIYTIYGAEQKEVQQAAPGDIISVTKIEELQLGDTLCSPEAPLTLPQMDFPSPLTSLTVESQSREDEEKISTGLRGLAEGDPTFQIGREQHSKELGITGISKLHLNIMLARLKRRYDVSVSTRTPAIPYLETITRKAEGHYRHKKQTGGRGQYGEVYLRVEPNERGEGFEFIDEIKGGVIPSQFIPAVEKGIRETLQDGPLAGYPVVDFKAAVYDGSFHTVDSSEAAFKIAGGRAFREAYLNAGPVLLEPIGEIEVFAPTEFMGDITGSLTGHRARIQGMDQQGPMQVIRADIPMAEAQRYNAELKSMTGGEGTFSLKFAYYQVVPPQLQSEIIARQQQQKD